MKNGTPWYDTDGNVIHAHGGYILKVDDYYYWYGEDRRGEYFISCYRTKDFKSFEFRNHVLTAQSRCEKSYVAWCDPRIKRPASVVPEKITTFASLQRFDRDGDIMANLERPKVLYCAETGKYVMWMHCENGYDYTTAACAVASCDTPDGDFVFHGSFNPFGIMVRDPTVVVDGDTAYYVAASRQHNQDLNMYRMTEDYLSVDKIAATLYQNQALEAPCFFKKDDRWYIITSDTTGWYTNQGTFGISKTDDITGRWSVMKNFGDATTFESQPAFVLTVEENGEPAYYYFGDRWGGSNETYEQSTYVVLKIRFNEANEPYIVWSEDAELPNIG